MNVSCREVSASQAVTFVSKLSIRPQITTSPYYISLVSPTPPTGSTLPYRAQRALHQCYQHEEHPSLELLLTTRKRYFVSYFYSRAYEGGKVTSTGSHPPPFGCGSLPLCSSSKHATLPCIPSIRVKSPLCLSPEPQGYATYAVSLGAISLIMSLDANNKSVNLDRKMSKGSLAIFRWLCACSLL